MDNNYAICEKFLQKIQWSLSLQITCKASRVHSYVAIFRHTNVNVNPKVVNVHYEL